MSVARSFRPLPLPGGGEAGCFRQDTKRVLFPLSADTGKYPPGAAQDVDCGRLGWGHLKFQSTDAPTLTLPLRQGEGIQAT